MQGGCLFTGRVVCKEATLARHERSHNLAELMDDVMDVIQKCCL